MSSPMTPQVEQAFGAALEKAAPALARNIGYMVRKGASLMVILLKLRSPSLTNTIAKSANAREVGNVEVAAMAYAKRLMADKEPGK